MIRKKIIFNLVSIYVPTSKQSFNESELNLSQKKRGKTQTMKTNLDMTGAGAVPGHRQPAQGGVGPLQDGVHFLTKLRVCLYNKKWEEK